MYAIFNHACRDFFARAKHEGSPVETVFARPDRAHTEVARLMAARIRQAEASAKVKGATIVPNPRKQAIEDRPVPVPFMSVWIAGFKFDPSRYSPATFRGITRDQSTGNATSVRFPRPVVSDVQVDLWCGDVGGELIAQNIEPQIESLFVDESVYLPIDFTLTKWYRPPFNVSEHCRAYGRTRIRLFTSSGGGWADNSELENGGDGPKEIRRTWSGQIEAYVPYRPTEARLVKSVTMVTLDDTDPDNVTTLDSLTVDAED